MKIWHIQRVGKYSYDDYDSAVVVAETEDAARRIHPNGDLTFRDGKWWMRGKATPEDWAYDSWVTPAPDSIRVVLVGEAASGLTAGVICASFNAG